MFMYFFLMGYLFKVKVPLQQKWWKYLLMAIVDVEANYLVVLSYRLTSITSVMLLDCFTIPSVMVLSRVVLGTKYSHQHLLGAVLCFLGLCLTVLSDVLSPEYGNSEMDGDGPEYPYALWGDLICLCGAFLYACMNVAEEAVVKTGSRTEFLGMLGLCGFSVSLLQVSLTEWSGLHRLMHIGPTRTGYLAGYVSCLFLMYSLVSVFLRLADAALFNLSLLTSDPYAVVFAFFTQGRLVNWLYVVSFFVTMTGLVIYSRQPPVSPGTPRPTDEPAPRAPSTEGAMIAKFDHPGLHLYLPDDQEDAGEVAVNGKDADNMGCFSRQDLI